MAFTFLAALGHDVGRSLLEPDRIEAARQALDRARARGIAVRLPVDVVVAASPDATAGIRTVSVREIPRDLMGLDIGEATVAQFAAALKTRGHRGLERAHGRVREAALRRRHHRRWPARWRRAAPSR